MARSQTVEIKAYKGVPIPMTWLTCIEATYDTPLVLFYDGLDDLKTYQLYIVYPSRIGNRAKLIANKNLSFMTGLGQGCRHLSHLLLGRE